MVWILNCDIGVTSFNPNKDVELNTVSFNLNLKKHMHSQKYFTSPTNLGTLLTQQKCCTNHQPDLITTMNNGTFW
jgi:hypothetical protein